MTRMLFWLLLGDFALGLVAAMVWWLVWGRRVGFSSATVAVSAVVAGTIGLLGEVVVRFAIGGWGLIFGLDLFGDLSWWFIDVRFVAPLGLGVLALVALAIPLRARPAGRTADLTRRSMLTYTRAWWLAGTGLLLALILLAVLGAGSLSEPDDLGRYTMYTISGGGASAGSSIYGWYYSIPAVIAIAALLAAAAVSLWLIARPPLAVDRSKDQQDRRLRSRNVFAVVAAALLVHFGDVIASLQGTASLVLTESSSVGSIRFWSTFSALGPALGVAAFVATSTGVALWAGVLLSGVRVRVRERELQRS